MTTASEDVLAPDSAHEHPDLRDGVESLKLGRYRRAARSFGRWVDATGPESCLNVAQLFAAERDQDRAVAFLHRLLTDQPTNIKALMLLVECLDDANRPLEALAAAREATVRCPGEVELWGVLAEHELALDVRAEALRAAEKGLALRPDDPELSRLKFEALLALRRVAEAGQVPLRLPAQEVAAIYERHDYAQQALQVLGQESRTDALRPHVQLLVFQGRFPEAMALARQAVDADPLKPYSRAVLAEVLFDRGRDDEAVLEAERALADGLDGEIAKQARRWIRRVVGDSPKWSYFTGSESAARGPASRRRRRRSYRRKTLRTRFPLLTLLAAAKAPRPDRLLEAAEAYARKGREHSTLRALENLPRLTPEPPDVAIREAKILIRLRRHGMAERVLTRLAARSPGDPALRLEIAWTLSRLDREDLAAEYAASAIAQDPSWAISYQLQAGYARWAQRPEQALETARSAVLALPDNPEMWGLLADLTPAAGSLQVVEEALARFPAHRHAELLIKIAKACRGSTESIAYQCLERALALDPADRTAMTEMAELLQSLGAHREAIRLLRASPPAADDNRLGRQYNAMGLPALAAEFSGKQGGRRSPGRMRLRRVHETEVLHSWEYWVASSRELDHLEDLSAYERAVVRGRYETYTLTKVRRVEFRGRAAALARRAATLLGGILAWFVILESAPHLPGASGLGSVAEASIAATAGLLLHGLVSRRINRLARGIRSAGAVELAALVGPGLALLYLARGPMPHVIGLCLLAMEVVLLARTAGPRTLQFATNLGDTLDQRRHPQDEIVHLLVMALDHLGKAGEESSLDERWSTAWLIETAARQIERDLMRNLPSRDPATGAWATTIAKEAAHALRVVKRRLLTGQGAVDHVTAELRRAAQAIATGEYGRLRRIPCHPTPDQRRNWKERALSIARAILIMGLPVLGISVLYPIIGITGGAYRTTLLAGAGWAALYLLLTLDPTLREKIELARSLFSTPGKNTESPPPDRPEPKNQPPDRIGGQDSHVVDASSFE